MKTLKTIAVLILVLLGVAVALVLLARAIGADLVDMRASLDHIIEPLFGAPLAPLKMILWAILLLVSSYFAALSLVRSDSRKKYLSVSDDQGTTSVSVKALENYLERSICKMESICGMSTSISLKGEDAYTVKLKGEVEEDKDLMSLRRTVKNRTKALLVEQLGLPEPTAIKLVIGELKPKDETIETGNPMNDQWSTDTEQ